MQKPPYSLDLSFVTDTVFRANLCFVIHGVGSRQVSQPGIHIGMLRLGSLGIGFRLLDLQLPGR